MVALDYMTAHKPRPSAAKRLLDQSVLPAAIDMAAGLEAGLERIAQATKVRPAIILGVALVLGATVARGAFSSRNRWF